MSKSSSIHGDFPRKFGKYHLLAPLAQGGMGALYLAVTGDSGFERLLCIKTVLPHLADKEYVSRFRDEAKIVVQLSHGNLIPVFDAGQVEGELFLAMDFVKGKDLRAVWNRCAKKAVAFPVDVAVYIIKELCRGLGYAHTFGSIDLVHRDVSPPNVLLSYTGEVKLTDFGLASSTMKVEKTVPGIIYGKVAYMSPEQARGDKLDCRSDIYACGIILWELLTGRQLFPPGTEQPQDLLKRARDPEVMAPSQKAPRVPAELDAIVLKALSSSQTTRYQNAEEFRDALSTLLATKYPACDANRVEAFIRTLFAEDIVSEEEERQALMDKISEDLSGSTDDDELRRLLKDAEIASDRRQNMTGPNEGRRGPDRGRKAVDRRGFVGRRSVDVIENAAASGSNSTVARVSSTTPGIAVDVPMPGQGGVTIITQPNLMAQDVANESVSNAALAKELVDTSSAPDLIGCVLENRYQVERLIGEGGMGRVYLAEHVDIGKKVAVKVLHPVYGRMPDLVERFRREARAASKIGHPNIVDVTDSGTTDSGSVYFVMEYLKGVELAAVIDREGAIDIRRALDIATQVCRALSAAHAVGIIHRDLKPENIFLTAREGTADFVKVLDFGIAKSSGAEEARAKKLTSPGMAMGTPEYMAPEQAAGKPADERCDVYALGAILYEMLTGSPPYEGANFMEILTHKATLEPTPPKAFREEIPDTLNDLLMKSMARIPKERPQSMEAFEYELTKCSSGRGIAVANILGIAHEDSLEASSRSVTSDGFFSESHRARTRDSRRISASQGVLAPSLAPAESGRGASVLGWVVLLIMIAGAGFAVLYVAKGESTAGNRPPLPEELAVPITTENEDVSKAVVTSNGDGDPTEKKLKSEKMKSRKLANSAKAKANGDKGKGKSKSAEKGQKTKSVKAPKNNKAASTLLSSASRDVGAQHFAAAQQKYQLVVSSGFLKKQGNVGLAKIAFQRGEFAEAIQFAKKGGNTVEANMVLGRSYYKLGSFGAAYDHYSKVLAKNPKNKEARESAQKSKAKL